PRVPRAFVAALTLLRKIRNPQKLREHQFKIWFRSQHFLFFSVGTIWFVCFITKSQSRFQIKHRNHAVVS
ncbi:hypothetical protein B0H19DRAFT_1386303, partial [Mycena capillaripes]